MARVRAESRRIRVRDGIGGHGCRLKACSGVAGASVAPPPDRAGNLPTLKGWSTVCSECFCDPFRVEWNGCRRIRGRRPPVADLPTATVGRPFRLNWRTTPRPSEVSRTRRRLGGSRGGVPPRRVRQGLSVARIRFRPLLRAGQFRSSLASLACPTGHRDARWPLPHLLRCTRVA